MALDVAHKMSKQDILAGYLNDAFFDNGAYGIEAAAETYFGTRGLEAHPRPGRPLAGIVENPSAYDPINNPADRAGAAQHRARADGADPRAVPGGRAKAAQATPWASTRPRCRAAAPPPPWATTGSSATT